MLSHRRHDITDSHLLKFPLVFPIWIVLHAQAFTNNIKNDGRLGRNYLISPLTN